MYVPSLAAMAAPPPPLPMMSVWGSQQWPHAFLNTNGSAAAVPTTTAPVSSATSAAAAAAASSAQDGAGPAVVMERLGVTREEAEALVRAGVDREQVLGGLAPLLARVVITDVSRVRPASFFRRLASEIIDLIVISGRLRWALPCLRASVHPTSNCHARQCKGMGQCAPFLLHCHRIN
jgi:hypothetical protein